MRMRMHWHVSKALVRNSLVCDRLEDDFKSLVQMQNRVWLIPFVCRCAVVVFFSVVLQPIISIVLFLSPSHCYMNCSIGIFFSSLFLYCMPMNGVHKVFYYEENTCIYHFFAHCARPKLASMASWRVAALKTLSKLYFHRSIVLTQFSIQQRTKLRNDVHIFFCSLSFSFFFLCLLCLCIVELHVLCNVSRNGATENSSSKKCEWFSKKLSWIYFRVRKKAQRDVCVCVLELWPLIFSFSRCYFT